MYPSHSRLVGLMAPRSHGSSVSWPLGFQCMVAVNLIKAYLRLCVDFAHFTKQLCHDMRAMDGVTWSTCLATIQQAQQQMHSVSDVTSSVVSSRRRLKPLFVI